MSRDLTFNIIFLPGTVPYLCVAARSLLRYSPYRFRLVSNGLRDEDLRTLAAFADTDDRLMFYAYPTTEPVEHGTLLTLLFNLRREEYFCFADSDIFARSGFGDWLEAELNDVDALGACSALLWEDLPASAGFLGRCTHTPAGTPNLGSYFAVYRAGPVSEAMARAGIGFEKRSRDRHLTAYERELLVEQGWRGGACDTGNLLGYELRKRGCRLAHRNTRALIHLGGMTWWLWKRKADPAQPVTLRDDDLGAEPADRSLDENALAALYQRRKKARAAWFASYLYYLFGHAPEPELAVSDGKLRARIVETRDEIRRAFGRVSDWNL